MKLSFSQSKPWNDRRGKHTVIEIRRGTGPVAFCPIIGKITGESGVAIPMMAYTVECEGIPKFTASSLKEAKARVQAKFTQR